jgi:hypothetical protein
MIDDLFTELIDFITSILGLVIRQEDDHFRWIKKIKDYLSRKKVTSITEYHSLQSFYWTQTPYFEVINPPHSVKPSAKYTEIPTGEYSYQYLFGYGNFCVSNGNLYITCGNKALWVTMADGTSGEYDLPMVPETFEISWGGSFPPTLFDTVTIHDIKTRCVFSSLHAFADGDFLLFVGGKRGEKYDPVVTGGNVYEHAMPFEYPDVAYVLNPDFTVQSTFQLRDFVRYIYTKYISGGKYGVRVDTGKPLLDIFVQGEKIGIVCRVYETITRKYTNQVYWFTKAGSPLGSSNIRHNYLYHEQNDCLVAKDFSGEVTVNDMVKTFFDTWDEADAFYNNPPSDVYWVQAPSAGEAGDPSICYCWVKYIGLATTSNYYHTRQKLPSLTTVALDTTHLAVYDPLNYAVKIVALDGTVERYIRLDHLEYFQYGTVPTVISTTDWAESVVQIAIDPYFPNFLYILFGTGKPMNEIMQPLLIGRCNIADE